jgi:hypothetical protein
MPSNRSIRALLGTDIDTVCSGAGARNDTAFV